MLLFRWNICKSNTIEIVIIDSIVSTTKKQNQTNVSRTVFQFSNLFDLSIKYFLFCLFCFVNFHITNRFNPYNFCLFFFLSKHISSIFDVGYHHYYVMMMMTWIFCFIRLPSYFFHDWSSSIDMWHFFMFSVVNIKYLRGSMTLLVDKKNSILLTKLYISPVIFNFFFVVMWCDLISMMIM